MKLLFTSRVGTLERKSSQLQEEAAYWWPPDLWQASTCLLGFAERMGNLRMFFPWSHKSTESDNVP